MDFNPFGSTPVGFQSITDLDTAVGLTVPLGAAFALFNAESQDVRWRDDDIALSPPTATVGMLLKKDTEFVYQGDLTKIKFIEVTASAKLNVSYYAATGGIVKP